MERRFIQSSYYQRLRLEMISGQRKVNHALDNYGLGMSKELREALEGLQEAHRAVLKQMEAERG